MSAGPEEISLALARLEQGRLVAFPTETVYGLGADALRQDAVAAVFDAKDRPDRNPLIVHVSGPDMAGIAVREWTNDAEKLALAFWPGSLSIILPKSSRIPPNVTAGGSTVAVRCPDHPLTLALIEAFGAPLVGPSANPSGRISPTTAEHVRASFPESLVYVLDGGPCRAGIESTVIDITGSRPRVLRPGLITPDMLAAVLGRHVETIETRADRADASSPLQSPGMLPQHYAPLSPARLIDPGELASLPTGAVVLSPSPVHGHACIPMPTSAREYAACLYSSLRQADASHPTLIAIVRPDMHRPADDEQEHAIWLAVMDRLSRAVAPGPPAPG